MTEYPESARNRPTGILVRGILSASVTIQPSVCLSPRDHLHGLLPRRISGRSACLKKSTGGSSWVPGTRSSGPEPGVSVADLRAVPRARDRWAHADVEPRTGRLPCNRSPRCRDVQRRRRARVRTLMRDDHRNELSNLLGRVSASTHADLVVLAECASQEAKRGNVLEQKQLLDEYECVLRAAIAEPEAPAKPQSTS